MEFHSNLIPTQHYLVCCFWSQKFNLYFIFNPQLLGVLLHGNARNLCIPINVQTIVFACENNRAVIHQGHVETLRMLHLAFQGIDELAILSENRKIEVVVVIGNQDLSSAVDTNTDWIVGDALASNLPQEDSLVVEDLHTVSSIVANEDFLLVIYNHPIWKFQVLGASKFVDDVSKLIKDDNTHDFAFYNDNSSFVVDGHSPWVLQYIGSKFADKLTILVVDLDLVGWTSLSDNDIS